MQQILNLTKIQAFDGCLATIAMVSKSFSEVMVVA